jgi:murein L,D-transpeptidase YcbB/YkuD
LAFVGPLASGVLALAAACALAAPAVAAERAPGASFPPAPTAREAAYADTDLGELLGRSEFVVAGERLNVGLLRRFYARHGFEPVWMTRPEKANALASAVLHADEQGLSPQLFHANLLLSPTLPPLYRELVLTDAVLSYADALARGVVTAGRRRDDEVLTPERVDVVAALDAAIASADPVAEIDALAPATPTYRLLRQALQNLHNGAPAAGKNASTRLRQIEVNLERERWLPRQLPPDRVWVNVADQRVVLYHDDRPIFATRVIIGQDELHNQSPEFEATINGVLFNPPWTIPKDIATNEILPKTVNDPTYLERNNMVILPDGTLQQRAGPDAGLGQLMFDMRNRFDVYLHDTPGKNLFSRADRRISHGCIRVEKARELAALLMDRPIDEIEQAIATGDTTRSDLPRPVPVFVIYETAFADADGKLQFRPDFYGRDPEIWIGLDPERRPAAESELSSQRGG